MNRFPLRNASGFGADILDWGATVAAIYTPDRSGNLLDVALGWRDLEDYRKNPEYLGAVVGRVANRIAGGRFTLDGVTYQTVLNDDPRPNSLHGGFSYAYRAWSMKHYDGRRLTLALTSPDGDAGYPGTLEIEVEYTVTDANELVIDYRYVSDRPTVVNLTNHTYFNLNGESSCDTSDLEIRIAAERYTRSVDLIPDGTTPPVDGTPLDLREFRRFADILKDVPLGCDDNFVVADAAGELRSIAVVRSPRTGIRLECLTTLPGVQFYMGGYLSDAPAGKNRNYSPCAGFCLETQYWPDAPNRPNFPSIRIDAGERHSARTIYRFTAEA